MTIESSTKLFLTTTIPSSNTHTENKTKQRSLISCEKRDQILKMGFFLGKPKTEQNRAGQDRTQRTKNEEERLDGNKGFCVFKLCV
ncbi:hypothetical protein CARUB_v10007557mg [Capsella rubella]|uniref:Uncharacterized protein n=1 Tax=Capsella rubella TaxID=81985 RepID=R0GPX8_9BRAS|nr:hypothetical protein CARUB_v10007557mg [Capsella rubella]